MTSKRQPSRALNSSIDRALRDPPQQLCDMIAPWVSLGDAQSLADRVRRRATRLARLHRAEAPGILRTRDQIVLLLYHTESSDGCFSGWCDGSIMRRDGHYAAGVGCAVMEPGGNMIAELTRSSSQTRSFEVETEALIALLRTGSELGAQRITAHTDCKALVERWIKRRDDLRLRELVTTVKDYEFFRLKAVPRRHNQTAHRLSRAAALGQQRPDSFGMSMSSER